MISTPRPFDSSWWEERIASQSSVEGHYWRRWRLVDAILQRFYVDLGLQPIFGWMGTELYQVGIASPCCMRAPRYFGRLCDGGGVHSEGDDASMVNEKLGGVRLDPFGPVGLQADRSWHPDTDQPRVPWDEYLEGAFETLRLSEAGVVGHEGCFHRRGRDLTPLMFRVALLLRVGEDAHGVDGRDFLQHVPTSGDVGDLQEAVDIMRIHGEDNPIGAPRSMAVRYRGVWSVLRNDGWVAGGGDVLDARFYWRAGASAERIAIYVRDLCS